ncbi:MAG: hypothetical protein ACD_82C00206G0001 [uncultured bacterium]|jgi:hypothetical protein|nr:MAG: hypothetical protein ACD_82C00206G0001 [uncultured bacterium]KKP29813.1 MAG: hypothetical protein UR12_C0002G0022 [candidate division TM6 bacterium GW2011_GWF2_30_66]
MGQINDNGFDASIFGIYNLIIKLFVMGKISRHYFYINEFSEQLDSVSILFSSSR